jgi:hypothetical protein
VDPVRDRAEISGAVQAKNPGYDAKGQRRQHEDDSSHALGPVAAAGRPVASLENTTSASCGTDRIASLWAVVQCGRGPWYIARSKALSLGLSNAYFRPLGLPSLFGAC